MSTVFNFTFVPWFRSVAPYIHKFRNQTFVIGLTGEAIAAGKLASIAQDGPRAFYRGPVADKIAAAVREAGGLMTADDLAHYRAVERLAIRGSYRGHDIVSMPPPSSGGALLVEMLNVLEGFALRPGDASETVEGIRALAIDKDHSPRWNPATVEGVTRQMVDAFFVSPWPAHAHPLRDLD